MSDNTGGGTTASFGTTPQAKDDYYGVDQSKITIWNVMENDLGGNAKVMYSIDDSNDDGYLDLLAKSTAGTVEYSEQGAEIWTLSDGRIAYNSGKFDYLGLGQTICDQFTYAIRLSSGTLSWATVTVTITGTNDGPVARADVAAAAEDASITGSVAANDSDADQNAVLTYTLDDPDNAPTGLTFNPDGTWSFDASSYDFLAKDQELELVITYTVTDEHGAESSSTLTIKVTGTNDAPVVTNGAAALAGAVTEAGSLDDGTAASGVASVSGQLAATDVDAGAVLGWSIVGTPSTTYGSIAVNPASGLWTYTLDNGLAATQQLKEGQSVTQSYTVRVTDEFGAYADQLVTVTIHGTNDAPVAVADLAEAGENQTISVDVLLNDTDVDDGHSFTLVSASAPADKGTASVVAGKVQWVPGSDFDHLAKDATETVVVAYTMKDEHGAESSSTLTITVTGTNDGPVVSGAVTGNATEDGAPVSLNALANASDIDDGAVLNVVGLPAVLPAGVTYNAAAKQFTLDPTHAAYQSLAGGATTTVTVNYDVSDGLATTPASVSWTVTGLNDAALFTGLDYQYVGENDSVNTVGGNLDSTDVDGVADAFTPASGTSVNGYGTFTIDAAGNWTYSLDNSNPFIDALYHEEAFDSFVVKAADGTEKVINITIAGNNDEAVIDGVITGEVTEAGTSGPGVPTATGLLTAEDVDNPDDTFKEVTAADNKLSVNGYGKFTMTANGQWTYTLNNSHVAMATLAAGMFLTDSFEVESIDGTKQLISITIHGDDDVVATPATEAGADPNDFDDRVGTGAVDNRANISGSNSQTVGDNITGGNADQNINGNNGPDTIYGGGGVDDIDGGNHDDVLYGQAGADDISGNNGLDTVYGGSGDDDITGGGDADTIYGGSGNDTIIGNNGDDIIIGGYGADTLTGGGDNDTFRYLDIKDTNDTILDFMVSGSDFIDLSGIYDDELTPVNDALGWGGTTPTAHGAWYAQGATNTVLYADTDGNAATAEFMVTLQGFSGWGTLYDQPLEGPPPGVIL